MNQNNNSMNDNNQQEGSDAQYYTDLHWKISEVRNSEMTARKKMATLINLIVDYHPEDDSQLTLMDEALQTMSLMDNVRLTRLFNAFCRVAERRVRMKKLLAPDAFYETIKVLTFDIDHHPTSYQYTCYDGEYDEIEWQVKESKKHMVTLPEELQDAKFHNIILRVSNLDRLLDYFPYGDKYNRSGYEILADLEREVLSYEGETFPRWPLIDYKLDGIAVFIFSHFEVDDTDPDHKNDTLYVIYEFDTTLS